ncbi:MULTISPECIES: GNAT family N-acetyltransferase [Microbacterium]|uniref:GNAT family N-acetyltransferase n=1 Tax=Microbacterium TaxID=33882 RepID=UPI00217EA421|nr:MULTISPECIES: GNAT family protein [Microbacterium]UWF78032.1 GNAT family N-acetyltransferase [Microbacterium neungamense]WCM56210.1 GNAT family N-acetyltransferase [Microbacterium sp. EF45047]
MEPVTLRTERLVLSIPTMTDVDAITEACQDTEVPRWTTVPSPYTAENAREFVEKVTTWWDERAETVWAIRRDGVLAGMIGLHRITDHPHGGEAEIGYWGAAAFRGQGLMTEAGRAVVDWAFGELGLVRLSWRAVVGNVPSARTARTLGFRYEGTLRQGLTGPRGRDDGWIAGLPAADDRTPVDWPVL